MKLYLPWPPSINHYYRRTEKTHLAISKRGKEYRLATKLAVALKHEPPFEAAVTVTVHLVAPDYRKRDLDNVLKCLLDAISKADVIKDDSMIVELNVYKHKPSGANCNTKHWGTGHVIVNIDNAPRDNVVVKKSGAWFI